jgi:hypothetical protein
VKLWCICGSSNDCYFSGVQFRGDAHYCP